MTELPCLMCKIIDDMNDDIDQRYLYGGDQRYLNGGDQRHLNGGGQRHLNGGGHRHLNGGGQRHLNGGDQRHFIAQIYYLYIFVCLSPTGPKSTSKHFSP